MPALATCLRTASIRPPSRIPTRLFSYHRKLRKPSPNPAKKLRIPRSTSTLFIGLQERLHQLPGRGQSHQKPQHDPNELEGGYTGHAGQIIPQKKTGHETTGHDQTEAQNQANTFKNVTLYLENVRIFLKNVF